MKCVLTMIFLPFFNSSFCFPELANNYSIFFLTRESHLDRDGVKLGSISLLNYFMAPVQLRAQFNVANSRVPLR